MNETTLIAIALAAIGACVYLALQEDAPQSVQSEDDMPDQTAGIVDETIGGLQSMIGEATNTSTEQDAARNTAAFLDMLAYAEGTSGPNGYRTLFGGGTFESFADHPRRVFPFRDKTGVERKTTAAGRYQFLSRTWDELKNKLGLPDFGPASQDAAALELIRQRGALADVRAGRVQDAVRKCANIWASLPGAGYNQPERKLSQLVTAYKSNGGTLGA